MAIIKFGQPAGDELPPDELTALLTSVMPDIPGYRLMRLIGKGGMSYVYVGVQESLDRQVAIKITAPHILKDEISKQRFEHEARTIAKLEHPCIVSIHEIGRTPQGLMYYVMPYLARGHLGQRDFRNGEARIIEVLRALLSGLDYAHARGIVHRDVKAENVLFDNADRPLLTDFGIALSKRSTVRITTEGLAVGSAGYMAPEQARGEQVDGRADFYSVGVLAFEMLTGHLPYQASEALALALMHAQDAIPALPPEKRHWQAFINMAMAKNRDQRFKNAQQMLTALDDLAIRRGANLPPVATSARFRLRQIPLWVAPAAMIALAIGVAGWWWVNRTQNKLPDFVTTAPVEKNTVPGNVSFAQPITATVTPSPAPVNTFSAVSGAFESQSLDYDPTAIGGRELAAATRQIKRNRLTTPIGDNASESILAAKTLGADEQQVITVANQFIDASSKAINRAQQQRRDREARSLFDRVKQFAEQGKFTDMPSWQALIQQNTTYLITRINRAGQQGNRSMLDEVIALSKSYEIAPEALESAIRRAQQAFDLPSGDAVPTRRLKMRLVVAPMKNKRGLAVMEREVSRGEFDLFIQSTNHSPGKCRSGLFARKSWSNPGFAQDNDHPVVCVSHNDAMAYSRWRSQRDEVSYRLPSSAEWHILSAGSNGLDSCTAGHINCNRNKGTSSGGGYRSTNLGLKDVFGNVAEWLSDGGSGAMAIAAGPSWRDLPGRASPRMIRNQNGERGYDNIGFRLVREVGIEDGLQ